MADTLEGSSPPKITETTAVDLEVLKQAVPHLQDKSDLLREWVRTLHELYLTTVGSVWRLGNNLDAILPDPQVNGPQPGKVPFVCLIGIQNLQKSQPSTPAPVAQNPLQRYTPKLPIELSIDKRGYPVGSDGKISLLFFGLGNQKFHLTNLEAPNDSNGVTVLHSTAGCGKTRTLYEFFSMTTGFYFTIPKGNGGAVDYQQMIRKFTNEATTLYDVIMEVQRLLECRSFVLRWVRTVVKDLTPYQWLLIQLYPKKFFGDDIFLRVYESPLQNLGGRELLPVALDETQSLLEFPKYGPFFYSAKDHELRRPLLSPIIQAMDGDFQLFLAGTSTEMKSAFELIVSQRKEYTVHQRFRVHTDANLMWSEYLHHFLPDVMRSDFVKLIAPRLCGRVRFLQYFAESYLMCSLKDSQEKLERAWENTLKVYKENSEGYVDFYNTSLNLFQSIYEFHFYNLHPTPRIRTSFKEATLAGFLPQNPDTTLPRDQTRERQFDIDEVLTIEVLTEQLLTFGPVLDKVDVPKEGKGQAFENLFIYALHHLPPNFLLSDLLFSEQSEQVPKCWQKPFSVPQRAPGRPMAVSPSLQEFWVSWDQNRGSIFRCPDCFGPDSIVPIFLDGKEEVLLSAQCKIAPAKMKSGELDRALTKSSPFADLENENDGTKKKTKGNKKKEDPKSKLGTLRRLRSSIPRLVRLVVVASHEMDDQAGSFREDGKDLILFLGLSQIQNIMAFCGDEWGWKGVWENLSSGKRKRSTNAGTGQNKRTKRS